MKLQVRMGETCMCVMFGIVKYLAVPVLLGASFNGKFVKRILLTKKKILPYTLQLLPTMMVHEASDDNRIITRTTNIIKGSVLAMETEEQKMSHA